MSTSRESRASQRNLGKAKENSRLVVLSLPSDLDTSGLSAHFSTLDLPMTDVKVLHKKDGTSRRMAFIGYSSASDAVKAKEWFDNTWLRGSRIKVDFAIPVDNDKLQSRKRGRSPLAVHEQVAELGQDAPLSAPLDDRAARKAPADIFTAASAELDHDTSELSDAEYLARRKRRIIGDEAVQLNRLIDHNTDVPSLSAHEASYRRNRLFLRNLPFDTTESSIRDAFATYGPIEQIHFPASGRQSRGLAYVTYARSADALAALEALDGQDFNGRLLHIMEAQEEPASTGTAVEGGLHASRPSYKQTKAAKLQLNVDKEFNWASLYMNSDAVLNSLAKRLNLPKGDILSPEASGAAAKLALAETMLLKETRDFFEAHGVRFDTRMDRRAEKSSTILLLKNLPSGTNANTLKGLLTPYGKLRHLLIPPSGLVAIVQFEEAQSATSAAKNVAYCKIGSSIVYVERGPAECVISEVATEDPQQDSALSEPSHAPAARSQCLFVQNFSRNTDAEVLQKLFKSRKGFRALKLVRNADEAQYAFVTFDSAESATETCKETNGQLFAGRRLHVAHSTEREGATSAHASLDNGGSATAKLVIKNLPFEASPADLRTLLSPYGKLLSLRIPRKADQSPRGFAFAHYATPAEAQLAIHGLRHTHLLGRHLVIEPEKGTEGL